MEEEFVFDNTDDSESFESSDDENSLSDESLTPGSPTSSVIELQNLNGQRIPEIEPLIESTSEDEGEYDCCFVFPTKPRFVSREVFSRVIRMGCHYRDYGYGPHGQSHPDSIKEKKRPDNMFECLPDIYTSTYFGGFGKIDSEVGAVVLWRCSAVVL